MEEEYLAKQATEEAAKRAAYESQVGVAKLATVSQLVSGEVVIKPPAGSISPGRSRSPGGCKAGKWCYRLGGANLLEF